MVAFGVHFPMVATLILISSSNPSRRPAKLSTWRVRSHALGIYWHQEELDDRGEKLVNQWKEIGYDCLIIWEDELVDDLDSVLDKIAEFIGKSTWQLSLPI